MAVRSLALQLDDSERSGRCHGDTCEHVTDTMVMWLALLALLVGCESTEPKASVSVPVVALRAFVASARVCILCVGVSDGTPIAHVWLTIDARATIHGVRLASLELTDADGRVLARGASRPFVTRMTEPPMRDLGPFDGSLAAGAHVVLRTGAQLDVPEPANATHFRVRITSDAGDVELTGRLEPAATTG
jgi:hypothetical protein